MFDLNLKNIGLGLLTVGSVLGIVAMTSDDVNTEEEEISSSDESKEEGQDK